MDTDFIQLQLMTRLKLQLKRRLDIKMDIHQFLADRNYAQQMLQIANESEDEDLIMYALQISNNLGWLGAKSASAKKPFFELPKRTPEAEQSLLAATTPQYIYGTRG